MNTGGADTDGDLNMEDIFNEFLVDYDDIVETDKHDAVGLDAQSELRKQKGKEVVRESTRDEHIGRRSSPALLQEEQQRKTPVPKNNTTVEEHPDRSSIPAPGSPSALSFSSQLAEAAVEERYDQDHAFEFNNENDDRDADILFLLQSGFSPLMQPRPLFCNPATPHPTSPLAIPPVPVVSSTPPPQAWYGLPKLPPNPEFDLLVEGSPWNIPVNAFDLGPARVSLSEAGGDFDREFALENILPDGQYGMQDHSPNPFAPAALHEQPFVPININDYSHDEFLAMLFPDQYPGGEQPSQPAQQDLNCTDMELEQGYRDAMAVWNQDMPPLMSSFDTPMPSNQDISASSYAQRSREINELARESQQDILDAEPFPPLPEDAPSSSSQTRSHPAKRPTHPISPLTAAAVARRTLYRIRHKSDPKAIDRKKWNRERIDDILAAGQPPPVIDMQDYSRVTAKTSDGEIIEVDVGSRSAEGKVKFVIRAKNKVYAWEQEVIQP